MKWYETIGEAFCAGRDEEREACAQLAERVAAEWQAEGLIEEAGGAVELAKRIRERGQE